MHLEYHESYMYWFRITQTERLNHNAITYPMPRMAVFLYIEILIY